MTPPLTVSLLQAGLHPEEADAKRRLADAAAAGLAGLASCDPAAACWVPGRLELFGTHTDYAGGRTLVAALPRGFIFCGSPRTDGQVCVLETCSAEQVVIAPGAATGASLRGWPRYVAAVVQRLTRNFPDATLGADVSLASDLPVAAGMSSSSALVVGTAVILIRLSGIRDSAAWRDNIADVIDEAGYYACMENGRDFRALQGDAGVGTHGGSEDHAAMLCGEPQTFTAFEFVPMRRIQSAQLPRNWSCIVASSGVAAEKTGAVQGAYNRLSEGTAVLLDLWNRSGGTAASLGAALGTDLSSAARLHQLIESADVPGWTPADLHGRLQHFVDEDARIPRAVAALGQKDARAFRELSTQSQADARTLLGNQIEETVVLAELAREHGAIASRSFGAGFGGSVWALVERGNREEFMEQWLDAYRSRFPARGATAFPADPGPGVLELITGR